MRKYFNKLCCVLEFILELLIGLGGMAQSAQTVGPCNTVQLNIDFGNATTTAPSLARHAQYRYQSGDCPNDGGYALLSATNGCFDNKWHSLPQDHTPGDVQGRMLLVNAALEPGPFFTWRATGLTPGTKMELGAWLVNICYTADGCTPTPPIVRLTLRSDDGRLVGLFETGAIAPTKFPKWQWYTGNFTVPAGVDALTLTMENLIKGGCGNDFAVDDITLATCTAPETPVVQATAPATPKPTATPRPTALPTAPLPKPSQRPVTVTAPRAANAPAQQPVVQPRAVTVIPPPIANRENPVVKTIEVAAGEIIIDLYDNGDIDGDIISIYHNNRLVVSRATLSGNPLTVRLSIDANQPYHELVMVAENLGSIPPNTAVMIVTAQKKRHEVFISSSEQKNAKVLLVLEK